MAHTRTILNLAAVAAMLLVIAFAAWRLLDHAEVLTGPPAEARIGEILSLSAAELTGAADFRREGLLHGRIFMRFQADAAAVDGLIERFGLRPGPAPPLAYDLPPWWPARGAGGVTYMAGGPLELWHREADGTCFVLIRGG